MFYRKPIEVLLEVSSTTRLPRGFIPKMGPMGTNVEQLPNNRRPVFVESIAHERQGTAERGFLYVILRHGCPGSEPYSTRVYISQRERGRFPIIPSVSRILDPRSLRDHDFIETRVPERETSGIIFDEKLGQFLDTEPYQFPNHSSEQIFQISSRFIFPIQFDRKFPSRYPVRTYNELRY